MIIPQHIACLQKDCFFFYFAVHTSYCLLNVLTNINIQNLDLLHTPKIHFSLLTNYVYLLFKIALHDRTLSGQALLKRFTQGSRHTCCIDSLTLLCDVAS